MTTKNTPGPWNVRYAADRADAFIEHGDRSNITDTSATLIAQCFMHSLEDEANARLIAAAPELLAALREAEKSLDWAGKVLQVTYPDSAFSESLTAARAAIAKATQP